MASKDTVITALGTDRIVTFYMMDGTRHSGLIVESTGDCLTFIRIEDPMNQLPYPGGLATAPRIYLAKAAIAVVPAVSGAGAVLDPAKLV